jgi:hypothetical protein
MLIVGVFLEQQQSRAKRMGKSHNSILSWDSFVSLVSASAVAIGFKTSSEWSM